MLVLAASFIRAAMSLDNRIRDLCEKVVGGKEEDADTALDELKSALHEHVTQTRTILRQYRPLWRRRPDRTEAGKPPEQKRPSENEPT